MDAKRFLTGTIVGSIALFATGYAIFTVAFAAFYAANAGTATGVDRSDQLLWAVLLGNVAYAALITFAMGNRLSTASVAGGAKIGAVVGFLLWLTVDLVFYGTTNIANLTRTIVDPLLEVVHGGIGGAAIAAVIQMVPTAGRKTS